MGQTQSIQVPDEVGVRADMNEVQIHLTWEGYDIALPLTVARMVADQTQYLVNRVGEPEPR